MERKAYTAFGESGRHRLHHSLWLFGLAATALAVSTKLPYVEPGDRLRAGIPPRYVTSRPGQLSLLPSARQEMSTVQSEAMLCGWE